MEIKKNPNIDLQKKKTLLFQISMIISLSLVFLAFQYRVYEIEAPSLLKAVDYTETDMIDIEATIQKKAEPPEPLISKITVIDNSESADQIESLPNIEGDENTVVPDLLFMPEPDPEPSIPVEDPIYIAEIMPEFPGGYTAMQNFIKANFKYPQIAKELGIDGTLYLEFTVDKDGRIKDVLIRRGLGSGLDEEALRVLGIMPDWIPGSQNGRKVAVRMSIPIKLRLN